MVAVNNVLLVAEYGETSRCAGLEPDLFLNIGRMSFGLRVILAKRLLRFSVRRRKLSSLLF